MENIQQITQVFFFHAFERFMIRYLTHSGHVKEASNGILQIASPIPQILFVIAHHV